MLGGGRPYLAHRPEQCMLRDDDDKQMEGISEFFRSWPATDVKGWEAESPELERAVDEGGCWTGGEFSETFLEGSKKPKSLTRLQSKHQAQTCSRSSARCPITTGSGSPLALPDMVSFDQNRPDFPCVSNLLADLFLSSHRHAQNPPLNSKHHTRRAGLHRVRPLCPGSRRSLPSSAEAVPGHEGEG